MLTVAQIKQILTDRNLRKVAELSGVSYSAVRNISIGNGDNLAVAVVQKLSDYLEVKHG